MSRSSYQRLVDHGRKAGLGTSELYNALRSRPPEGNDQPYGHSDGNGYSTNYSADGHRVYRPVSGPK